MINEIKFTVVTVDFEESKLITYKCSSLKELIQKLFFEGYYEDNSVSEKFLNILSEFIEYLFEKELIVDWSNNEEPEYHVEERSAMAEIVCYFIKKYNPEFEYKIIEDSIPMLPFYGVDQKGRHIGHIGYGLSSC